MSRGAALFLTLCAFTLGYILADANAAVDRAVQAVTNGHRAATIEDVDTGCHYLVARGGITPRLGAHGEHIGCRPALRRSRPIHPPAPEV